MESVENLRKMLTRDSAGRLKLDLSFRGLTRVPEAVSLMTEVEVLDLSHNPITDITDTLSKLTHLKVLRLKRCSLRNVTSLSQLSTLETLDLRGNYDVQNLQECIIQLKQLKELDMSYCGLMRIKADFTQLTSLEELNLSGNPIKTFPKRFLNSNHLRKLDLIGCGMTEIGTIITQLTSLKELNLSDNPIQSLPRSFSHLIHLRKLDLSKCKLKKIGKAITQLDSLEELNLSSNPIKTLPKGLSYLYHLTKLDLSGCKLAMIALTAISQLISLEELKLSKNPITTLPQGFLKLSNLTKLDLHCCSLKEVDTVVTQLTSLEELNLSLNPIQSIPVDFSNLNHLRKLDLHYCGLRKIETVITQLISLEELDLSHNSIKSTPEDFSNLSHLRTLHLFHCQLKEIGTGITQLSSLEELDLSSNPIQSIPEDVSNLNNLRKLALSFCYMADIGTGITQLTSLEELNVSWNRLQSLPEGFSNLNHLQKLDLSFCHLKDVGTGITHLTSLEELNVSWNPIKRLPEHFSNLNHLRKLVLWHCELTEIGTVITQLSSLEELDLSHNSQIQSLPGGFSNLNHLRKLNLCDCGLTILPEELCDMNGLRDLDLSNNQLSELPQSLANLKNLHHLDVDYNLLQMPPEVCHQGVAAIFNYLLEIRFGKVMHQKVVLLGSSGAGKTSLAKTMVNSKSSCVHKDDRTIVLDRIIWEPRREESTFNVTLIDFGGNDWYKLVHHLFIEANAFFLLVANLAEYSKEHFQRDIGSWLSVLLLRVPEATIRLVGTHADKCTIQEDIESKCKEIAGNVECIYERQGLNCEELPPITLISSLSMMGISELQDELLNLIFEKRKVIPSSWLELYKEIQSPNRKGKPYLTLEDVKDIDEEITRQSKKIRREQRMVGEQEAASLKEESSKKSVVDNKTPRRSIVKAFKEVFCGLRESSEKHRSDRGQKVEYSTEESSNNEWIVGSERRLYSILEFFHIIGTILWYQHSPELSHFVFHNPDYLTDLLKAVFSERLKTKSLHYDEDIAFKIKFSPDLFKQVKENLLQRGDMSRDLLQSLWNYKKLNQEVFDAMIHLFTHLDFCYPLSTDQEGHVTSLRFPWFLTDTAPQDADVQQILCGPPAVECHRLTMEYEFLRICPPPMYETFTVRMHRHIPDKNSRKDWKDGFFAHMFDSRVLVQRLHRNTEAVISLTVEGKDVVELWEVLLKLKEEMQEVIKEWPGIQLGCQYNTFLVCPHCVHDCVKRPFKFQGENTDKECPKRQRWMKCKRGGLTTDVPACLVHYVKGM